MGTFFLVIFGVGPVAEIAHLIDDQDVGVGVGGEELAEPAAPGSEGKLLDEGGSRGEAHLEAILDHPLR
jgi:hypothetical protein